MRSTPANGQRPTANGQRPTRVYLMSNKRVPEKVIAVGLVLPVQSRTVAEEHLAELEKLIETAGGLVVDRILARRPKPDPATFIGKGKAEQLKAAVDRAGATLV